MHKVAEILKQLQYGPRYNAMDVVDVRCSFFDIDDTLVSKNKSDLPSDRFIAASHEAGEFAQIGVATARPLAKAEYIIKTAHMQGLSILSNGAQIYDGSTGEMKVERALPIKATLEIVRALHSEDIEHWVQDNGIDYAWLNDGTRSSINSLGKYLCANDIWQPAHTKNAILLPDYVPEKPFVIAAQNITEEQLQLMKEIGEEYRQAHITAVVAAETPQPDGNKLYEVFFIDERGNKKNALQEVSEMNKIDIVHTMVTGDGLNDAEIVECAGIGVAMGNSVDQTLSVATYIAPNLESDGARIALQQLVLKRSGL